MNDLIGALQIMRKQSENKYSPTSCGHDELSVFVDDVRRFSRDEKKRLDELGFFLSEEDFYIEFPEDSEWLDWDLASLDDGDIGGHRCVSLRFASFRFALAVREGQA